MAPLSSEFHAASLAGLPEAGLNGKPLKTLCVSAFGNGKQERKIGTNRSVPFLRDFLYRLPCPVSLGYSTSPGNKKQIRTFVSV